MYTVPRPRVVIWYRVYCAFMVLSNLLVAALGVSLFKFAEDLAEALAGDLPEVNELGHGYAIEGVFLIGLGLVLLLVYAIGLFLPRSPAAWIYGIVMIAIGMTNVCFLPATVPLLLYWIKPETQQYFGKGPKLPEWEDWR